MKVTRDFTHGRWSAKDGDTLDRDTMHEMGGDTLRHLRDVAKVISGEIPESIGDSPRATQAGAITADEHQARLDRAHKARTKKPASPPRMAR
jgi:hypothetical protein